MEIIVGIVVVLVALIVIGKIKGAPDPASMSDAALVGRLQSEGAWMNRYNRLPYENQQSISLKKMYTEKTAYIEKIEQEIFKRQISYQKTHLETAISNELTPIFERAQELIKEGRHEQDAIALALKEMIEKNKWRV